MNVDEAIRRLKALLARTEPESAAARELIEVIRLLTEGA